MKPAIVFAVLLTIGAAMMGTGIAMAVSLAEDASPPPGPYTVIYWDGTTRTTLNHVTKLQFHDRCVWCFGSQGRDGPWIAVSGQYTIQNESRQVSGVAQ